MAYREGQGLEQQYSPKRPETDLSGALSLTVEAVTLIGNIFPTLVAFKLKKRSERTATDLLIGSLAVTDILAVVMPLPVSLPSFIAQDSWTGGKSACLYYQFMVFWLQNSAMLLVTAMALERFLAICLPMRYKRWTTRTRVRITIAFVYTFAFTTSCLPFFGLAPPVVLVKDDENPESSKALCRSWISSGPDHWHQSIFPMVLILEGWITMVLVLILNTCIIRRLTRFRRRLESTEVTYPMRPKDSRAETPSVATEPAVPGPSSSTVDRRSLREFSKLVIVVTVLFYCTWLPVMVVMTLTQCGMVVSQLVAVYAVMSTTLNGLLNPFVYGALSRQYRQGYFRLLNSLGTRCGLHRICKGCVSSNTASETPQQSNTSTKKQTEQTSLKCINITVNNTAETEQLNTTQDEQRKETSI
ncbi:thyrotropin-releasing hormone receptor-like [Patiria miniata]|uniref:G-protein coupled receptors family 1 profile domain-containing protein n=1 Tax=Patiria miniata TaxID=46514 RepID=A0A913Z0Q1_PATMI|nr:thyrotropin-releasing hormone receptor-like [Patiria miniata]